MKVEIEGEVGVIGVMKVGEGVVPVVEVVEVVEVEGGMLPFLLFCKRFGGGLKLLKDVVEGEGERDWKEDGRDGEGEAKEREEVE